MDCGLRIEMRVAPQAPRADVAGRGRSLRDAACFVGRDRTCLSSVTGPADVTDDKIERSDLRSSDR